MKNSYGNFFIQSQSRIDFLKRGKRRFIQSEISSQNESVSSQTRSRCFLAPLQSSFTEICRVSTSLLKFSRKFAINHRQSSNRFSALDKPIKKYIQLEDQSKKTRTKTRWDARLACLANFSTEGRGKKSFKQGKYAVSLFRRQRVLPSKEMSENLKQRRKRAKQGNKSNAGEAR